jgi:hypothetical protein
MCRTSFYARLGGGEAQHHLNWDTETQYFQKYAQQMYIWAFIWKNDAVAIGSYIQDG